MIVSNTGILVIQKLYHLIRFHETIRACVPIPVSHHISLLAVDTHNTRDTSGGVEIVQPYVHRLLHVHTTPSSKGLLESEYLTGVVNGISALLPSFRINEDHFVAYHKHMVSVPAFDDSGFRVNILFTSTPNMHGMNGNNIRFVGHPRTQQGRRSSLTLHTDAC